jgi:hypothetical protein
MKKSALVLSLLMCATSASADLSDKLGKLVGYSIVHNGIITGYQDPRKKQNDAFEGCEYGRKIFIDSTYQVTCLTHSYSYSYRPNVVILVRGEVMKMVVGDEIYDIAK